MAKSKHTFSKRQREKDKQKKHKEKMEKMEERRIAKAESDTQGPDIDWSSAPINNTLDQEEERRREAIKQKHDD